MNFWGDKGRQRGTASTEAVIATPAFVVLVLTAIELIVISWKVLSLQMIANQAARSYAIWEGCNGIGSWVACRQRNNSPDWVLDTVKTSVRDTLGKRYLLNLTDSNSAVTLTPLVENRLPDLCGASSAVPGTEDGRGDLFEIRVTLQNDILGLGLFQFMLEGKATAVLEPYGR